MRTGLTAASLSPRAAGAHCSLPIAAQLHELLRLSGKWPWRADGSGNVLQVAKLDADAQEHPELGVFMQPQPAEELM